MQQSAALFAALIFLLVFYAGHVVLIALMQTESSSASQIRSNSVSVVVSCFIPREWARENFCVNNEFLPLSEHNTTSNVAIVLLVNDFLSPALRQFTVANKQKYANRWGYTLYAPSVAEAESYSKPWPFPWGKFPLLQKVLHKHEFALMLDADAIINNHEIPLSSLISKIHNTNHMMLISKDFNGVNSGVFLMKRGVAASMFLDEAWKSAELLASSPYLPLKYENRAFFYLLDEWPQCFGYRRIDAVMAPRYNATMADFFRQHTLYVDRCLINVRPDSKMDNLLSSSMSFDLWNDKTFILHVAGGSNVTKSLFMMDYMKRFAKTLRF